MDLSIVMRLTLAAAAMLAAAGCARMPPGSASENPCPPAATASTPEAEKPCAYGT